MTYQDYEFTNLDLTHYESIHDNKHPYNLINSLESLCAYYRPSIKKTTIQLAEYFEQKNINLYAESMKWLVQNHDKNKESNIFELFAVGIELGKIDILNNQEHNFLLREIYTVKNNSTAKTLFDNKLIILKELIKSDHIYIDSLAPFLKEYDNNHNFDVPMKKRLESYINTLPINLEQYPQLTSFYMDMHKQSYLVIEHHEIYQINIDSTAIANQHKRSTKDIQNSLVTALSFIRFSLAEGNLFNEKNDFKFIRYEREAELTTKIDARFIVGNKFSYNLLENSLNLVIPEIIDGIINKKPYDSNGIQQLMKNLYLFDKLQNNAPEKTDVKTKIKI